MARDDVQLSAAKRAYKNASMEGNRQEEARWANVIGDILKNRGEYVEALKWLRIDYEVSVKHLPEKQLLPTCQSLGEVYLRLQHFKDALIYQKKHLELAKDTDDLVEQQRASTQLGRTYHELFLRSEDDHYSVRNAKKYFMSAMKLARLLKEKKSSNKSSSYLKEFIDAHNNIGMLEMDLDNLEEAQKILHEGLRICDEEEVIEDDDGRSRLHHNLGSLYMELRMWDKARDHIEKDIIICKRIGHCQGEAKGYINLGELHYRVQKYDEAVLCYQKALDLAKSMEDEDTLVDQIGQNIETVKEAVKVMDELKKEEQNLKKLTRTMVIARGTASERKCLLQQSECLDHLIEKCSMIFAWTKHREFAKRKKTVASELCDKEKLSDSFLAIGESYQKLRTFKKALKWYMKSWDTYRSIGNLEGQALAKINIGDVLDADGDWASALNAFEDGYRIAVQANLPSVQISALENMHYSHMIRFENVEEARRLKLLIDKLKQSTKGAIGKHNLSEDCCSETDTEGDDYVSDNRSNSCYSPIKDESDPRRQIPLTSIEESVDDVPLVSFLRSHKNSSKLKSAQVGNPGTSIKPTDASPESLSDLTGNQETVAGRKRIRVVLSDDEGDRDDELECSRVRFHKCPVEDIATSDDLKSNCNIRAAPATKSQDASLLLASKHACIPINLEESTCSYRSRSHNSAAQNGTDLKSSSTGEVANASNCGSKFDDDHVYDSLLHKQKGVLLNPHAFDGDSCWQHVAFKIDDELVHVDAHSCMANSKLNIECLKVEVACLYYLQLSEEKRSRGLLPIIRHMKWGGKPIESVKEIETLNNQIWGNDWIEVAIDGWVHKRLMMLYLDCCKKLSEAPNMKLLKKLYNLEVSEDEIVVSNCEFQDLSVTPFLNALHEHKAVALLDLSHNLLGNGTMERLQQIFTSSSQKYGGLTLDLHCNRFGPTALFQICECPVLFARLEVLNISGNRLTDACGSYLSTILKNCKALYSLNIEHCSITSRTIQKVADALDDGSVLAQLYLGNNNPISGNAMVSLLTKLANLGRFSELNLNGIKLSKPVVDGLCRLVKTSSLTGLMLGATGIAPDGVLQLIETMLNGSCELVKLDLSDNGLTSHCFVRLSADASSVDGILELNLSGNSLGPEGANALASLLVYPQCHLKVLVLNKCHIGFTGVLQIIHALAENNSLEELHLAENADLDKENTLLYDLTAQESSKCIQQNLKTDDVTPQICASEETGLVHQGSCEAKTGCNPLEVADRDENPPEVADSDDETIGKERVSVLDDSCTSSCQRNLASPKSQLIQELSTAIAMAKQLKLLDLSSNGFTACIAETLYNAWSSRCGLACRHIEEQIIHFSVDGKDCCGVKPCCKRD